MTKMAATLIYGKTHSKIFSPEPVDTWYVASGTKVKIVDFSQTIAASDLKVGRSRHLIEFMKLCEY